MAFIIRLPIIASLFIIYFAVLTPLYPIYWVWPQRFRFFAIRFLSKISKVTLSVMGIKIRKNGIFKEDSNFLIVGNHLSYLDVLIYSSVFPTCFVTSVEVRDTFFLGHLCKLVGCVFVERRSRSGLKNEIQEITHALNAGLNVAVFPEATSTNGESVLRFKRPLFQSSLDSGKPVLPLCLNYLKINNEPIDLNTRDNVFWYGDMEFLGHFLNLISLKSVICEVKVIPEITDKSVKDITELSVQAHELISREFKPVIA